MPCFGFVWHMFCILVKEFHAIQPPFSAIFHFGGDLVFANVKVGPGSGHGGARKLHAPNAQIKMIH